MSHPDDDAQAVDPRIIDILIEAAAPEKAKEWRELRQQYEVTFHPIADRKGATLRARGRRVEFDNKTMIWLWLLGFAGWSAFRLHSPHILWREMTGAALDGQLRATIRHTAKPKGSSERSDTLFMISVSWQLLTMIVSGLMESRDRSLIRTVSTSSRRRRLISQWLRRPICCCMRCAMSGLTLMAVGR